MAEDYFLPHDDAESRRLNRQHNGYKASVGFLLHPRIATALDGRPNVRIADIATGTGAWLRDLETSVPATWSLTGFDVVPDKFPPSSSTRSSRCEFRVLDIKQPPPVELQGSFDVVHIRFLFGALRTTDWSTVAANALAILRPGGWLQWNELSTTTLRACPNDVGVVVERSQQFYDRMIDIMQEDGQCMPDDMPRFHERVALAGFENVEVYRPRSDRVLEARSILSVCTYEGLASVARQWYAVGKITDNLETEALECIRRVEAGQEYVTLEIDVLTARKP